MSATTSLSLMIQEIVRARASRAVTGEELVPDALLGAGGLGLDSIAIAEVLIDCEARFGVSVTGLLEGEPLTLRRLVEHLEQGTPA
jgi:acyl carrier protein